MNHINRKILTCFPWRPVSFISFSPFIGINCGFHAVDFVLNSFPQICGNLVIGYITFENPPFSHTVVSERALTIPALAKVTNLKG